MNPAETPVWQLYVQGRNFHRLNGIYADSERNYRMYNGNQWAGLKLGNVEPVQKNFIKPIVKYKVSVIHDNLYAIVYNPIPFQDSRARAEAQRCCKLLTRYAAQIWEQDKLDFKGRRVTKDAAINDEGILYVDFDPEKMLPSNEILKKSDIYYGNENDDDLQSQPYILIRRRLPLSWVLEFAREQGLPKGKRAEIRGDSEVSDPDPIVTVIYHFYRQEGTVHYSVATRWVTLAKNLDTGLTLYPLAHFNWEAKEGSARGEGEVRYLIPNQIEVNKTEMRRVLTVRAQAYPHKVVDVTRVANPEALNTVGGVLHTKGMGVDDVSKILGTVPPAQMSPDVKQLQDDLIQMSRDLAGAGDSATGQIDPERASGKAILAVQQASQAPMSEQKESYKNFLEDLARIWLEYLTVHAAEGLTVEETVFDTETGTELSVPAVVTQEQLRRLQTTVKIDVTPKGVYDRFAQEQTVENLLVKGFFQPQMVGQLQVYYKVLPDDAVAPKVLIGAAIDHIQEQQHKIAQLEAKARTLILAATAPNTAR